MMVHSLGVWHRTGDGYTLQSTTDLLRTNFHSKSVTHAVLSVAQSVLDSGRFAASNEDGRLCVCLLSVCRENTSVAVHAVADKGAQVVLAV
jgi:hypothetical protein